MKYTTITETKVRHAKTVSGQKAKVAEHSSDSPTKYLYPIFAIAVAPGVTNVMHEIKYVVVANATPEDRMLVGRISAL
jgi:hypothetical protein